MHIPDDPAYYEKFYFTPGDLGFHPIQTSVGCLGVLVCWDQWYPEAARLMALQGAQMLIYPTAIGYESSDTPEEQERQRMAWQTVQRGHAVANGLPVITLTSFSHIDASHPFQNAQAWTATVPTTVVMMVAIIWRIFRTVDHLILHFIRNFVKGFDKMRGGSDRTGLMAVCWMLSRHLPAGRLCRHGHAPAPTPLPRDLACKNTSSTHAQPYASCANHTQRYDKMQQPVLRLTEVVGDETDGLGAEELGMGTLVAVGERVGQGTTTADPGVQAVEGHMRVAVRKVQHGKFRLAIGFDLEHIH
jgi:hypothetical protein